MRYLYPEARLFHLPVDEPGDRRGASWARPNPSCLRALSTASMTSSCSNSTFPMSSSLDSRYSLLMGV
jgi:hypothetical protein